MISVHKTSVKRKIFQCVKIINGACVTFKMSQSEIIISGPQYPFKIYEGSLPEYLLERLRAVPQDDIIYVNGESGEQLSVREFLKAGVEVAEGLKQLGLRLGTDIVPVLGDFSWNTLAAAFGGILSGVLIYPLDPNYKAFELKQLLKHSPPRVIFCEKKCAQHVLETLHLLEVVSARIFLLDEENSNDPRFSNFSDILKKNDVNTYTPPPITSPTNTVAMVLATSGTTGLPKGVMLTHRNVMNRLQIQEQISFTKNRAPYLTLTHFFWVSGIFAIFSACLTGFKNIFIRNATIAMTLNVIEKYKPEWTFFIPTTIAQLMAHSDFKKHDLSSLKCIRVGGSTLPKVTADRIKNEWSSQVFCAQLYGITELTGGFTAMTNANFYSVGLLGTGIQLKVVDLPTGKTLGPNQIGELRFKSRYGTMKGYLGYEEATREMFDETGFFRSGDLGYYTQDNHLFVVDRIKEFITWKTFHISPSEIEDAIMNIPGVEDVGVVGVPHEEEVSRSTALVVKKPGYEITEQRIIDFVADKLSVQKHLYGGVKFVNSIPRTPTGKIKRHLLAKMV